jgi:hypothetical protein
MLLLPLVVASDPVERDAMVAELKAAQRGCLAPILAAAGDDNLAKRAP